MEFSTELKQNIAYSQFFKKLQFLKDRKRTN